MNLRISAICFLLVFCSPVYGQEPQGQERDDCRDVLIYNGRNYSEKQATIGILLHTYNQNCQNDSVNVNMGMTGTAEFPYKGIPTHFGTTVDNKVTTMAEFCKQFYEEYKDHRAYYDSESQVVNETTKSWLTCELGRNKGIQFEPKIVGAKVFTLGIKRKDSREISVLGVKFDPKEINCTVPNTDTVKHRVTADEDTKMTLKSTYWNVTCTRIAGQKDGKLIYPETTVSIDTDGANPFTYYMPPSYPADVSKQIQDEFDALKGQLDQEAFTIKWDQLTKDYIDLQSYDQKTDDLDLNKHDICILNEVYTQILSGADVDCKLTQADDGSWNLHAQHQPLPTGSHITCHAKCGTIVRK
jgi:hypothetical protein